VREEPVEGERLPAGAWENRLIREGGGRFVEVGPTDVDRLARLGSDADHLGPRLVVGMWDEPSPLEVGGYLRHWAQGGPTTVSNLALLCRRHHRAVHEGAYQVDRQPDGALPFRRPDGRPLPEVPPPAAARRRDRSGRR